MQDINNYLKVGLNFLLMLFYICKENIFISLIVKVLRMKKLLVLFFLIPLVIYPQSTFEQDVELAFQNAKQGIAWGLSNIPDSKASMDKSIIKDDKLIADVKLSKEVEGVKITSVGYYNTYQVTITAYRSFESLKKEGF